MKFVITYSLLMIGLSANAQIDNVTKIVEAERAFARMAKDQNTRDAFLFYMADSVVTAGTSGPVIGKEDIRKQKAGNSWLYWDVAYADISSGGEIGYTTGPWEYRINKADKDPVAYGEFNSIWRKQPDGTWKNICDIGVNHGKGPSVDSIKYSAGDGRGFSYAVSDTDNKHYGDQRFNGKLTRNAKKAYEKYLSPNARIVHEGRLPSTASEFIGNPEKIKSITCLGGYMPKSGDLAFTYGRAVVEIVKNGKKELKTGTYLRVWKTYKIKYEIVLDVLKY